MLGALQAITTQNHMSNKVWDEITYLSQNFNDWHKITYPFPNFNGFTVEVWEWISNFIPHCMMGVIVYHAEIKVNPC